MIDHQPLPKVKSPAPNPGGGMAEPANRFAHWFRCWNKHIRRWLSRRGRVPAAEVDDLAQEVFVRLLRHSKETMVENPLSYVLTVASHVAHDWRRRARVARPHDDSWLDELLIEPHEQPENCISRSYSEDALHAALVSLPERQQKVLLLRANEELTSKQIAARLNLSERIVLRDLSRAYGRLRMQLDAKDLLD